MPFQKNKTFKELGLDPKARFRVIATDHGYYSKDDILELVEDDNSNNPLFKRISDGVQEYCSLNRLEYAEKTWDTLRQGDVLEKEGLSDYTVQGTMGEIVFYTWDENGSLSTLTALKSAGRKIKQEQETTEVTLEEIADNMNIPVDKLRIKE